VTAALSNPDRTFRRLYGTKEALRTLETDFDADFGGLDIRPMETSQLDGLVRDAPHQGLILDCDPLPDVHIEDALLNLAENTAILVLDQVTDPHNVGAILRSAAAFGAAFIVTQDRHSPPETGALAKAASGALEVVPWVRSVNLARALEVIAEAGFWRIGLDGAAPLLLADATSGQRTCLVLGAEGVGLRQNVAAHCDALARLPISDRMESLNVSNAAAVALYAVSQK
jgi:23S rRNA (guanosine2251-2'-O)-methyltransferase